MKANIIKENNLYNIAANTILIFREKVNVVIFSVALLLFLGLFSFFYGLITIPVPGGVFGFYRMVAPTAFEIFYMVFSSIVSSLIVTITIYATKLKIKGGTKGKGASALGLVTGIFGAVCPACLGINLLAFGNVFTAQLSFLIPYILWIQIGGIILLSTGLYLVAKSAYEKKCISCSVDVPSSALKKKSTDNAVLDKKFTAIALLVVIIFAYQITTVFGKSTQINTGSSEATLITKSGEKINIYNVIESVTPKAGFETTVKWNGIVSKMVKDGVLDPGKLEGILTKRYKQEMRPEWRDVLAGRGTNLSINSDNAVFMMYVLWTFAKHNENGILTDSPFAKNFKNYDIGVGRSGYGDTSLLALTPSQQAIAKKVSENAYRPCCGNSTAAPDCSHGYSALGLVELMASQGFSEEEIFNTFVKFNSFWFPETYIKDALYLKVTEGKNWSEVNKEIVAGKDYSSLSGSYKVKNYLKSNFGI